MSQSQADIEVAQFLGYQVHQRSDRETGKAYFVLVRSSGTTVPPCGPIWSDTVQKAWLLLGEDFAYQPETFVAVLNKMRELGSSISFNWDEESNLWDCAWITSGVRFSSLSGDILKTVIDCVLKSFRKYQVL